MSRRRQGRREPGLESILRLADQINANDSDVQQLVTAAIATGSPNVRKRIEKRLAAMTAR
ncbi:MULTISPECIES: hypothetical protein [Halobacteriaceae]|uniref:hypothetical protein n=1 Tax=Halobacteriaceae TaxID=2236 RepID=UPI0011876804|nr:MULTISPECIES: hypothetical protein [Halobacteriaceae]MDR5657854.1 hypothetical protein [Halodesulfurarchaeum sp. HSR-GB]